MIIYQNLPYKNATCTAKFYEDRIDATIFFSLASAVRKTTLSQDADVIIFRQQSSRMNSIFISFFLRYKMVWNILKCFFFLYKPQTFNAFYKPQKAVYKKAQKCPKPF